MSTLAIVMLTIGAWGQRLGAVFLIGPRLQSRPVLTRAVNLIPAAVVMAVIVQLTVADGRSLVVDARLAGMATAAVLVWRKAPFLLVVLSAAAVTATLRALHGL